ncbi:MAG TPA: glutamate synthase large subunit, partial [Limnochordia bacterium]|nr:glutamate synthase large subunit [Limnochordia bacterium]
TIVYKGLLMAHQLGEFYLDLGRSEYQTALAVYHQRYSTNTTPTWQRAQPFRALAHNGEINTLQGNINWMRSRSAELESELLDTDLLRPVLDVSGSDSAILDNALELLSLSGRDLVHAAMMLVPEAWEEIPDLDQARRDFYRYHSTLVEPWDGPAGLAFTDGRIVAALLDRNGLRPLRYTLTHDGLVVAGSEVGTLDIEPDRVKKFGRLGPGQVLAIDTQTGQILENASVKAKYCAGKPYGEWLKQHMVDAGAVGTAAAAASAPELAADAVERLQAAFGYTSEELTVVLRPMVEDGKEPNGSMGDDTPNAVLSFQDRPLFHYFKERFAEVTNPPIDHLRERLVFSLRTLLGARGNLLAERPEQAHLIELKSPILLDEELSALRALGDSDPAFRSATLPTVFPAADGPAGLQRAVRELCRRAEAAVRDGAHLLILSDRALDEQHALIPSLLATAAVHHHLLRTELRNRASLVVESGEPREVHHFAALVGYGAGAVNPYLALASATHMRLREELDDTQARKHFKKAVENGLLKVMSKMGIATVDSYCGAQIFEAVGLDAELIDECFTGTPSVVSGNTFEHIGELVLRWHREAFGPAFKKLGMYGFYKPRKDGEYHDWSPQTARMIHEATQLGLGVLDRDFTEHYAKYKEFAALVQSHKGQLRDLLDFTSEREPIDLSEVEPVEAIVKRFSTAQMSLGSLSSEAHETLAIAMNRLGGRSGSGEGGEDPARYGTERQSAVKQIASGRFGVTPAYLANAVELQIKMAQGSKPGEGGQIPGHKVSDYIARLRHTVPGVALISPPPHHDIYSIEDLAQLIYDLKRANPQAEVSVKLVSQTGVGIIAAGVAKGYSDLILISGNAGGTGSSPLNSIKNAGLPWEIGLAETQQALVANGLRGKVGVRADGGMKTGRDIVVAALLGADEFSFGTGAMISEGCIMARVCHTNNCPVGIASQKPELREKFPGTPESVMNYMCYVAQEVREILARLGYRSLQEVIGRTELLQQITTGHPASDRLDLSPLLAKPDGWENSARHRVDARNPLPHEERLEAKIVEAAEPALAKRAPVKLRLSIRNSDRTVGATLSYEIAKRYGDEGLPHGSVQVAFVGQAGQSFGAFLSPGVHFTLEGQANDYVGKGLAGGEIVVRPPKELPIIPHENVICGNTVLYGATNGAFYAAGRAGERFCVRNSGALAVVEGIGDHGCEYMTGGVVVVLGPTGYNFGAGMTGGQAFVYDVDGRFNRRYNAQLVEAVPVSGFEEQRLLKKILLDHFERTNSQQALKILSNWEVEVRRFLRVAPISEVGAIESSNEG